ncbi:hypothetical protein BDY21DRAFT_191946 [Lineolata rhizophorae]|uniref:Uncharacterized protein n=1 Tax=Lineolata rhizophorae TaxID=578093 RepID=A0A6A6P6A4_9PEZI|nr:hypothetical protein BDY21DRAFT_191946 [Lineolata rhizophorae]
MIEILWASWRSGCVNSWSWGQVSLNAWSLLAHEWSRHLIQCATTAVRSRGDGSFTCLLLLSLHAFSDAYRWREGTRGFGRAASRCRRRRGQRRNTIGSCLYLMSVASDWSGSALISPTSNNLTLASAQPKRRERERAVPVPRAGKLDSRTVSADAWWNRAYGPVPFTWAV